jgi:hypothetical protein
MKVWVEKVVTYDHLPVGKMHFHVRFAEEDARFHRSCAVIVFIDSRDRRSLNDLKTQAIDDAKAFLREIVGAEVPAKAALPETTTPGGVEEFH